MARQNHNFSPFLVTQSEEAEKALGISVIAALLLKVAFFFLL
jgi:hypothetical protein